MSLYKLTLLRDLLQFCIVIHSQLQNKWRYKGNTKIFRDLLKLKTFQYPLESEATSDKDIKVTVKHSKVIKDKVDKNYQRLIDFTDLRYNVMAGKPAVLLNLPKLCEMLTRNQVKKNARMLKGRQTLGGRSI